MEYESYQRAAYKGSKDFSQQEVHTANATGFVAAADDYAERGIDLNEELIGNKPATFFFRMNSDAMTGAGIYNGDVLIVDRSLKAINGKVIVAVVNDELLIRRLQISFNKTSLVPENKNYCPVELTEFCSHNVWGVVTYVIHAL